MAKGGELQHVEVRCRADLREWLAENHGQGSSVWLVTFKKHCADYLPFGEVVEELICWGWVDSAVRTVDADRTKHLISPRSPSSAWSAVNKEKAEKARASGAMTDAGEKAIELARSNGMWEFLDDVDRLEVPGDLAAALSSTGATGAWNAWPRSVKRSALEWIKTANRASTRAARVDDVVESAVRGLRPAPFRR
jgi:uncharacterized protein YdeI (YjbR/CyaY-like superfamily)